MGLPYFDDEIDFPYSFDEIDFVKIVPSTDTHIERPLTSIGTPMNALIVPSAIADEFKRYLATLRLELLKTYLADVFYLTVIRRE